MKRTVGTLAVALGLVSGSIANADHTTAFTNAGSCAPEIGFYVPVDAARARAVVDDVRFTVVEHGGVARLGGFIESCESSVDGGASSASVIGGVFVVTDPATSVGSCESYSFFWTNSEDDAWLAAMRDLGWAAPLVPGSTLTASTTAGPVTAVEAAVPLEGSPWSMTLHAPMPAHPAVPFVSVHCHAGPRGVVRGTFDHRFTGFGAGAGEVRFGAGALWEALGIAGSTHRLPGLIFEFTWEGVTELVGER